MQPKIKLPDDLIYNGDVEIYDNQYIIRYIDPLSCTTQNVGRFGSIDVWDQITIPVHELSLPRAVKRINRTVYFRIEEQQAVIIKKIKW